MAEDNLDSKKKDKLLDEVMPTLFVAIGGTGAQVLWRVRRRILNTLWGDAAHPVRIENLTEFPYANFLQIDLSFDETTQSGKASKDILDSAVRFKEEEKVIKKLDLNRYTRSDDDLDRFPVIKEWFPLSRKVINELNINPDKGAGQIRAISRLYFYDKYEDIKAAIRSKCDALLSNVSSDALQKRLGLKVKTGALKIVVIGSTAGGTGSGSFLDLGYLSKWIGKKVATAGDSVHLVLMLPSGYNAANKTRTEANTYAALMEMETSMRQGSGYIKRWAEHEYLPELPGTPYDEIYLLDTSNLAGAKTQAIDDIYDMAADALFEDFSTADFANRKRSISVNQNQHKVLPYETPLPRDTYGDMKLSFSRAYSSFGQSTIDTHLDQKKNAAQFRHVNDMLRQFFGLAASDSRSNIPTESERDEILAQRLYLGTANEIIEYDFVEGTAEFRKGAERISYPLSYELLRVNNVARLDIIESNITAQFEEIRTGGSYKEWLTKVDELMQRIDQDTVKGVESASGLHEDAIARRRGELLAQLLDPAGQDGLIRALWSRVDNKERGGLEYTIELIKRLKDRLENANTGLARALEQNSKWFADLSGHLRNEECARLRDHLQQAVGKFFGAQAQAEAKLKQLGEAVRLYVRYHLLAVANREAAVLAHELSQGMGRQTGTDEEGNPTWAGFIGRLEAGRDLIRDIITDTEDRIARTEEAIKQQHAMYIVLPLRAQVEQQPTLPPQLAREWAEDVFRDFGGTERLFSMLSEAEGRAELLGKLRNRAAALADGRGEASERENPLFEALDAHPNRSQLFADFLLRAMPWVSATVDGYLKPSSPEEQYKCLIGVKDSQTFEKRYGRELLSRLPTSSKITAKEVGFVEIGMPGKVVCYVELSGLPLPSLKSLNEWYSSYQSEGIPVHTHKRVSTFVHARELSLPELASRAEDFQLFVQAVALGVLQRIAKGDTMGNYTVQKENGSRLPVGDEKRIRLNGFSAANRQTLEQQVGNDLEQLANDEQRALWVALLKHYATKAYPVAIFQASDDAAAQERTSLPTLMCQRLRDEASQRLQRKLGKVEAEQLIDEASEQLAQWTEEVAGSASDTYAYEVGLEGIAPKRVLNRDVLRAGWSWRAARAVQPPAAGPVAPVMVPPPPPPPMAISLYVLVQGQASGPFTADQFGALLADGRLRRDSMVWMPGMPAWATAQQVAQLQAVFLTPPPPPPPLS